MHLRITRTRTKNKNQNQIMTNNTDEKWTTRIDGIFLRHLLSITAHTTTKEGDVTMRMMITTLLRQFVSFRFVSIRFDSIRFDSIRFDSIRLNRKHSTLIVRVAATTVLYCTEAVSNIYTAWNYSIEYILRGIHTLNTTTTTTTTITTTTTTITITTCSVEQESETGAANRLPVVNN